MHRLQLTGRIQWAWLVMITVAMFAPSVRAQVIEGNAAGIRVTGRGVNAAKPDMLELTATVSGEAELASDAIVKYRDNRRRAVETIEKLEIADLKIVGSAVRINVGGDPNQQMQAMMRGQPVAPTTAGGRVSESIRLQLTGIGKLEDHELVQTITRLIDAGKDAGVTIGPTLPNNIIQMQLQQGQATSLVRFKLSDAGPAKELAYVAAMADARKQAERLAQLAGVKLGKVTAIEASNASMPQTPVRSYYAMMGLAMAAAEEEYFSDTMDPINVSVSLVVQFAIE